MLSAWRVFLLFMVGLTLSVQFSAANPGIRVDEDATLVRIHPDRVETLLAVTNSSRRPTRARVRCEFLDELNRVIARVDQEALLKPGLNKVAAEFPGETSRYTLWRRLRYEVTSAPDRAAVGTISVSQICPDIFQLCIINPIITPRAARCRVRVRAEHPVSSNPIEGVNIRAELSFEGTSSTLNGSAVTDSEGFAVLDFAVPAEVTGDGEINVAGSRNGLSATETASIRIDRAIRVSISTDKPIYQPGQTLHTRVLVLDPSKRAVADAEITLRVLDPEEAVIHAATLKTSRFGVASDDWFIPVGTRLGEYRVEIKRDDFDEQALYALPCRVRISRYELPNFTVKVKPNRGFYLPGQNAEVEVRGDYLFGRPVTRGRVRVVRETSREWNYREQKWEIEEEEKYEGDLDSEGRFIARVDLSKQHDELDERDYARFQDVSYAAYVTDLTTNRTEQRRFDLRVTKDPIHLYVIEDGLRTRNAPLNFYLSSFYADGAPAECEVEVSQMKDLAGERLLRKVKTNRYGLARISGIVIAGSEDGSGSRGQDWGAELSFKARDNQGRTGHVTESIWYYGSDQVRIQTNKSIYRPGEAIEVLVTATGQPARLFIDVAQNWKLIHSQTIPLRNGRGRFTLPFMPAYTDEVTIAAYGDTASRTFVAGARTVLFPKPNGLMLDVKPNRSQYRPGEEASVEFLVRRGDGQPAESALGVSVIDRAVEERARTDAEFTGGFNLARAFYRLWGYEQAIAGITRRDLERVDLTKPIPDDLQLLAEILLLRRGYYPEKTRGSIGSAHQEFQHIIDAQIEPLRAALESRYARKQQYPTNVAMLTRELAEFGLDFAQMRDPWGVGYIPKFSVSNDRDALRLFSAGPDKRVGTADDFTVAELDWPYFRLLGQQIDRAVQQFHDRTGGYIRDRLTLIGELRRRGVDIANLKDRWGKRYTFDFGVDGNFFTIKINSGGKDRRFETGRNASTDDFTVWTSKVDYFAGTRSKIDAALASYFKQTNRFPQTEGELRQALGRGSIDFDTLRDPWGNRYYATFNTESRYGDRVRIISFSQYQKEAQQRIEVTPVTQTINFIHLRSCGRDGKKGTPDDFDAASYSRIVAEQAAQDTVPKPADLAVALSGATGAIGGYVKDANGAVIPGAKVKATHKRSGGVFEVTTADDGRYLLANVPAGVYEVQFGASGFRSLLVVEVPVSSSTVTELDATLLAGAVAETVTVTGEASPVQTQTEQVSEVKSMPVNTPLVSTKQVTQISTPRLREYFPETLVWQPALETSLNGRARLSFKLADNITTWKMSVIASTVDGEVGTVEKEILAFQPFFVEHDPPRVLTEGDEIALPVVLRNYLDKRQSVEVEMKAEPWFVLLTPRKKQAEVEAGDSTRQVFEFRAVASIDDGKQRVIASGAEDSDAIEKPITIHPDGQELTQTTTQIFSDSASIAVNVPSAAMRGSAKAELKIFPNLMAHVVESIEGIMRRPHGCAEQTISSAYPSLLMLRYLKSKGGESSALAQKARRYVEAAYDQLLNYRDQDGGFSYWGRGEADSALTAYALRFLSESSELIGVDEDVIKGTLQWLTKHQQADGSWPLGFKTEAERVRSASLAAYIARVLTSVSKNDADKSKVSASLRRALNFLAQRVEETDEPYLIASYALASINYGDRAGAERAIEKLRAIAHDEGNGSYWKLETNTPFYGWGIAGRIEATALAVQALAQYPSGWEGREKNKSSASPTRSNEDLISRGLLFLLRQKDRFGVWYSTQATVNVLDALVSVLGNRAPESGALSSPVEIFVNDRRLPPIAIPLATRLTEPISTDISQYLVVGTNRIELRRAAGSPQASAQIVESHYERWPAAADESLRGSGSAGAMRLQVRYDRTDAKVGEEITCTVRAERVGFRGYGMMLAEIGLPPGSQVDRLSLERALKESGWGIDQYDVLPDRLIAYLWPQAGGTQFQFKLKPRYGIKALTAPSLLYDYYNPEARAVVQPSSFVIK